MADVPLVRVDVPARRAWLGDRELALSRLVYGVLACLTSNAGRVVPSDQILREVWSTTWGGTGKSVPMHISWLRKALGDSTAERVYITTIHGTGYRFEAALLDPSSVFRVAVPTPPVDEVTARLDRIEAALHELTALIVRDREPTLTVTGGGGRA